MTRPGFGSRYDKFTPNDSNDLRDTHRGVPEFRPFATKTCRKCRVVKSTKGGTNKNRVFICEDCNNAN